MIYDIRHRTTYVYEAPVTFARCTLRLLPSAAPDQAVLSTALDVSPAPTVRTERISFFGHKVLSLTLETSHRELQVDARSRVEVNRPPLPPAGDSPPWEAVRDAVHGARTLGPTSPVHYLYPSRLVALSEPITTYARRSFPPGRPVLAAATELMHRIKTEFSYDKKATLVSTPLQTAFQMRRGVCQDFAHIMIAGLRGLGLPAAYVSGYLRTIVPPGAKRLEGADATHAWVAVWCGAELDWIGLDPTNDLGVVNDHVVLARGRDYADISPIDGVILGSGGQKLRVAVDMIPLDADEEGSADAAAGPTATSSHAADSRTPDSKPPASDPRDSRPREARPAGSPAVTPPKDASAPASPKR